MEQEANKDPKTNGELGKGVVTCKVEGVCNLHIHEIL